MSKQLIEFVHIDGESYGPGDKVPADVAKRITNPAAWGESDQDSPQEDSDQQGGDYSKLKKADLVAAIEGRNADRDEAGQIVPEGTTNADLVAALQADDAALAESNAADPEE